MPFFNFLFFFFPKIDQAALLSLPKNPKPKNNLVIKSPPSLNDLARGTHSKTNGAAQSSALKSYPRSRVIKPTMNTFAAAKPVRPLQLLHNMGHLQLTMKMLQVAVHFKKCDFICQLTWPHMKVFLMTIQKLACCPIFKAKSQEGKKSVMHLHTGFFKCGSFCCPLQNPINANFFATFDCDLMYLFFGVSRLSQLTQRLPTPS